MRMKQQDFYIDSRHLTQKSLHYCPKYNIESLYCQEESVKFETNLNIKENFAPNGLSYPVGYAV